MFCIYCKTKNPSNANFCGECGKQLPADLGSRFITCFSCQESNPYHALFCRSCGDSLTERRDITRIPTGPLSGVNDEQTHISPLQPLSPLSLDGAPMPAEGAPMAYGTPLVGGAPMLPMPVDGAPMVH